MMSGVDGGAEQDFEACVLEWENRVGLWDRLVGDALASSGDGSRRLSQKLWGRMGRWRDRRWSLPRSVAG